MNILADTHIVVWSLDINSPLSVGHREILQDTRNRIITSHVSLIELARPNEKRILNNVIWDESMEIPLEQQALVMQRKQDSQENPGNMPDCKIASTTLTP